MPHDKFNKPIKVGDEVIIRFKVESVTPSEEYCNAQLKSIESMPPYPDSFITLSAVNTRQTEKVDTATA